MFPKLAAILLLSILSVNAATADTQCTGGCISNCIARALPQSGCDAMDIACVCASSRFNNAAASCVFSTCPSQIGAALNFQRQMCSRNNSNGCATSCLQNASARSSCSHSDIKCLCNDINFKASANSCVQQSCPAQVQTAQTFQKQICGC